MKKLILLVTAITIGFLSSGCATWGGIKKDTNEAYNSTKKAIHKATD